MNQKNRRKALKSLVAASPAIWAKPVLGSFVLPAHAQMSPNIDAPILSDSVTLSNSVCSAQITVNVYQSGASISPCPAGTLGYIYEISNVGAIDIVDFSVSVVSANVISAGWFDSGGVAPASTTINANDVTWGFSAPNIGPAMTSQSLFICSDLTSGNGTISFNCIVLGAGGNFPVPSGPPIAAL